MVVALPAVGFRYDEKRHAYVLRRIGNERGPVIRDARLRGRLVRKARTDDDEALDNPQVAMAGAHAEGERGAPSTATMVGDHDGGETPKCRDLRRVEPRRTVKPGNQQNRRGIGTIREGYASGDIVQYEIEKDDGSRFMEDQAEVGRT